ncbi:FecR family protein [Brevundimonas abyssalis]|nr:FecR domain-containing protein [Brevundimonas abyssalis]
MGEEGASPEAISARVGALQRARRSGRRRWRARSGIWKAVAAIGVIGLLLGAFVGWRWTDARPLVYETGMGERRVVQLADGSTVSLDSSSEVRVRYSADARQLSLERGQARFEVAHDTGRPFTVRAGDQIVVATGTAFNIDMLGPEVLVTLLDGRITVMNVPVDTAESAPRSGRASGSAIPAEQPSSASVNLTPGQQIVIRPATIAEVKPVSASRATAWETGQLVFEDEPLSAAAARVSRYSGRRIAVEGPAADLRISGVFKAGDAGGFVDIVSRYLPVSARSESSGEITLRTTPDGV